MKTVLKTFIITNIITIIFLVILVKAFNMSYKNAEMVLIVIAALITFIGISCFKSPRSTMSNMNYQYTRSASHQDIKSRWGQDFDLIRSGYGAFLYCFIIAITMFAYCFAIEKLFI